MRRRNYRCYWTGLHVGNAEFLEDKSVQARTFTVVVVKAAHTEVTSCHLHTKEQRVVVGLQVAQLGYPLGRLPVGGSTVIEPAGHEHGRVVLRGHVLVGRVGALIGVNRRVGRVAELIPVPRPPGVRRRRATMSAAGISAT